MATIAAAEAEASKQFNKKDLVTALADQHHLSKRASQKMLDDLFRSAVAAIDAGDIAGLERFVTEHPPLVRDRLEVAGPWLRDKVGDALPRRLLSKAVSALVCGGRPGP